MVKCRPSFSCVRELSFLAIFSETVAVAASLCFEKLNTTPEFPLIFVNTSSESSAINTSATSLSFTTPIPSIPVSKRASDCISLSPSILSPTRTRYLIFSSSLTYPAGIEKFCAVRIFETLLIVTVFVISAAFLALSFWSESSSLADFNSS